jgi:hypothetical protein
MHRRSSPAPSRTAPHRTLRYAVCVALRSEHAEEWAERVAAARQKADNSFLRALSKLREVEDQRCQLRAVSNWLAARGTGQSLQKAAVVRSGALAVRDPRHSDSRMAVPFVFDLLSEYGERSGLAGERAAREAVAEREAEDEQRHEQIRQARASLGS